LFFGQGKRKLTKHQERDRGYDWRFHELASWHLVQFSGVLVPPLLDPPSADGQGDADGLRGGGVARLDHDLQRAALALGRQALFIHDALQSQMGHAEVPLMLLRRVRESRTVCRSAGMRLGRRAPDP
jgi:hypothetical protein